MKKRLAFIRFCYVLAAILVACFVGVGLFVGSVWAADVPMRWDASDGALGYKIYKSEDLRQTWDAGVDVGNVTTYTYQGIREDGPVDFRVSAYNANGESVRLWSGAWYNHTLRPVSDPGGAGIE